MTTYKIVRKYQNAHYDDEQVETGLSLAEAKKHCKDPETSSNTCSLKENVRRTKERGSWFDCFYREENND